MQYRYAADSNFEDFASGRVFYALPGQPAFPVRLASEIYQRCRAHWCTAGGEGRCTVYDPTCGGAYWLAALAYLHWEGISTIYASDVDAEALGLAERNLSLLSLPGLDRRIEEIETLLSAYGKGSHAGALESAKRFHQNLTIHLQSHRVTNHIFQADGTDSETILQEIGDARIDILMADVPYGRHSEWRGTELRNENSPTWQMLDALTPIFSTGSVIAIVADKRQKIRHDGYQRLERFQVGKRRIEILRLT
jgi:hypothetical protein